jgi:hypothetical protein
MQAQTITGLEPELSPAARRLLHQIVSEHRLFTGNADCRAMLIQGGYIVIVHRQGDWFRLRATARGFAAL